MHILPATVRDRLGFAFFLFAGWVSLIGAWQHPTLLALFSGLHNMVLAFLYAIRKPETAYDRTGLWLGLIAAFLPMPFVAEEIPTFLTILGLCGYALIFWSLTALGQSFGIAPADRGLVINGPYSLVRHPLYLGELILRGALLLGTAPLDGAVALIILLMVQVLRIVREEKVIAGYSDYASHVRWRLIPFIF